LTDAAGFAAWLGAAMVVLADGRRGLALGLAIMSAAFAALVWAAGEPAGGLVLLAGGLAASGLRLRAGPADWGLLPAGSTPRLILTVVMGLVALWIAVSATSAGGEALRFAALAALTMMIARILQGGVPAVVLTAAAGMSLAAGAAAALAASAPGVVPFAVAALVAAGISLVPGVEPRGA
jgi:hypothetical protein